MNILSLDTSSDSLSLALAEQKEGENFSITDELNEPSKARHGETLLLHIENLLKKNNTEIQQIDLIIVGVGPGLFTGTRIGTATAQALSFSLGVPCVGVPSIWAIREALFEQTEEQIIIPTIRAYRGEVYSATYQKTSEGCWEELDAVAYLSAEKLIERIKRQEKENKIIIGGNGLSELEQYISETSHTQQAAFLQTLLQSAQSIMPEAKHLIADGLTFFKNDSANQHPPIPMYIRPTDAELDLKKPMQSNFP